MSSPVTQDDIVQAAVTWLLGFPDVLAALGTFVIDGELAPGLFQYETWTPIEGSSSTACVINNDGGWTGPNQHNTLRFPRLLVEILADPMRDSGFNNTDSGEVRRRATAAFTAIDAHLHRPQGGTMLWGQLRVVESVRLTEPMIYRVPDGDGLVRLQTYYAVTQG